MNLPPEIIESIKQDAEKKYPGKTKKSGSHGVLVRENRLAYICGRQEQLEKDMEFVEWTRNGEQLFSFRNGRWTPYPYNEYTRSYTTTELYIEFVKYIKTKSI